MLMYIYIYSFLNVHIDIQIKVSAAAFIQPKMNVKFSSTIEIIIYKYMILVENIVQWY